MDKNKRLTVWLPVIIAASIALGIFIGNHYLSISQGKKAVLLQRQQDKCHLGHYRRAIC